jgi:hypothetical protein
VTKRDGRMTYEDGQEVHAGDQIEEWAAGPKGTVVFVLERNEWMPGYERDKWMSLKRGFMVLSESGSRIHFNLPSQTMRLLKRGEEA